MERRSGSRVIKRAGGISDSSDSSQAKVYKIAVGGHVSVDTNDPSANTPIKIDREVRNLVNWLAEQQGITPERALKKAVLLAAYIQDVTTNQGGKLLVQRKDNSLGEIILK